MTDNVKLAAPKIWEKIQKSKNILMHCHPGPDPDSVGSTLALGSCLAAIGKNVTLIKGDSDLRPALKALPGIDRILLQNFFQTDLSKFDLFLILDSSNTSQISKLGKVVFPDSLNTVVIDHHNSNEGFGQVNLVDKSYSSASQIVFDLLKIWNLEIGKDAALCLLLGIYGDSGGFKYPPTDHNTLLAAAELAKINPDFTKAIFALENNNEPEQVAYLGLALSSVEHYFSGQVAMSVVSYEKLKEKNILPRQTEKMDVANTLKSVTGWKIGVSFVEVEPGIVSVSFRTQDSEKYDVSKIAVATGFGGGHKAAAGTRLPMKFDKAKQFLLETIKKTYPELGEI